MFSVSFCDFNIVSVWLWLNNCFAFAFELHQPGPACESLELCVDGACFNGGTCVEEQSSFRCLCLNGFSGAVCERQLKCGDALCERAIDCRDSVSISRMTLSLLL